MKKPIAMLIISALLAATISGCNEETESKPQTSSSQVSSSSEQQSSSSSTEDSISSSTVESSSSAEESSSSTEESSSSAEESSSQSSSSSKPQSSSSSSSSSKPQSSSTSSSKPQSSSSSSSSSSKPQSSSSSSSSSTPEVTSKITLGNVLPFSAESIYTAGENAVVIGTENGIMLVELNGKALIDKEFSGATGFTKEEYVYLGGDLYDSTGKLIIKNCISYNDGYALLKEKTGVGVSMSGSGAEVITYKYTFKNQKTGNVYYTVDIEECIDGDIYVNAYCSDIYDFGNDGKYIFYCATARARAGYISCIVSSTKYGNVDVLEKMKKLTNDPQTKVHGFSITESGEFFVKYKNEFADDYENAIVDIVNDTITPCDTSIVDIDYLRNSNLAVVRYETPRRKPYKITDKSLKTVYLEGIANVYKTNSAKYLRVSDTKKWGYFDVKTHKTTWYDDATDFCNGYAFVVQDGKGHFIDENLNPVSDDITASNAIFYSSSVIRIDDKVYTVNYPQ